MRTGRSTGSFWSGTVLIALALGALAALVWAAPAAFQTEAGRLPAMVVGVMRSRAVVYNPGVAGYYERLFGAPHPMFMSEKEYEAWTRGAEDVIYDRSFRIRRFRPNLKMLRTRSQPQGLTTNSFGFPGRQWALEKPEGTRRIAVLGDSVAQGWGVRQDRSFIAMMEQRLNEEPGRRRFEVLNFAVTGYELTQILDVAAEDVPRFAPDVCLLALTELAVFRNWDEHLAWTVRLGIDPKYDFLRDAVRRSGASRKDAALDILGKLAPFRIPVLRGAFAEMKARAARSGMRFIVLLVPTLEDGDAGRTRFYGIAEMLSSLGIQVVDLRETFGGTLDAESLRINPFDVHPNVRGHGMIADNLYTKLRGAPELWAAVAGAGF